MDRQAIIEKIKALMAKANDRGATEAESLAFMNKALEMLSKNNLEEKDLQAHEIEINIDETAYKVNADLSWFGRLANAVSRMYFCRSVSRSKYELGKKSATHYYCFVGKEHNRLMAVSMFDYLMKTMHRLARNASDNVKDQYEFKKGCATRLGLRIHAINEANIKPSVESGGLPALYNKELALVDEFMSDMNLGKRNKVGLKANTNAFYLGVNAGNNISLNNQINARQGSTLLLN